MLLHSLTRPVEEKVRYAEVIGDPIAQSKSPAIHKYWLSRLSLAGDYRRTRVPKGSLAGFLEERRGSENWLGCNVTIPHKEEAAALVEWLEPRAKAIGAVNCIVPDQGSFAGYNTDIDGVEAALAGVDIGGQTAIVIGGGGAARAVIAYLAENGAAKIRLLVRNPSRAAALSSLAVMTALEIRPFDQARTALEGASVIINASPLGMAGAEAMPARFLETVGSHSSGTTLFDMVTTPALTPLLRAGQEAGARCVDGLTMLVGQAARAFSLFYGHPAPACDRKLREILLQESVS